MDGNERSGANGNVGKRFGIEVRRGKQHAGARLCGLGTLGVEVLIDNGRGGKRRFPPHFSEPPPEPPIGDFMNASVEPSVVASSVPEVAPRSEEHTSELQSLMRTSYAVFCLKQKT